MFMTYTTTNHQGAIKMSWLHFCVAVTLYININIYIKLYIQLLAERFKQ